MTIAIQSIESFSDFVNKFEEVYKNQLIYRTLIVYGNETYVSIYKYMFEQNNNSVYVVNNKNIEFYTNNENDGEIYEINSDETVGQKIGIFKQGEPLFD